MSLDFSTPRWLQIHYFSFGTLSLLLNSATILLVVFQSTKIDNFRYFLLTFQILCTIGDFHLTILMQPMPLFPLISGFSTGILAVFFRFWTHYMMAFVTASMVAQMECLAFCFLKKHQTIAKIMNRHVLPAVFINSITILSFLLPVFYFFAFCKAGMRRVDQMDYVREHFPQYFDGFSSLPNFAIYTLNAWFLTLAAISFLGGVFCTCLFTFTTVDMFKMLRGAQRKVSVSNYQRHQSAVKSLLAQFATSSLCLTPPFLFIVIIMCQLESAQVIVRGLIVIFSMHSPVNAIVLIVTTPPYRNFVLKKLGRKPILVKVSTSRNSFL